ncbi:MAG: hypothetical protein V1874_12600 [Spirochaetota bacterium]
MKYMMALLIATSVILSGCLTMPDPIDDVYLKEKTSEENVKLDKIGTDIIAKKKDKDVIEKDAEIAALKAELSKKEVTEISATNASLEEKEKLYTATGDSKLAEIQKQKEANNLKLIQAKAKQEYSTAKKDETNALLEVKKSELAVKVAELSYEKALIAKAYQMKRQKEYAKNMIDETDYKKFMDDQKIKLEDYQKEYQKAAKITSDAQEKLKNTGYEGDK